MTDFFLTMIKTWTHWIAQPQSCMTVQAVHTNSHKPYVSQTYSLVDQGTTGVEEQFFHHKHWKGTHAFHTPYFKTVGKEVVLDRIASQAVPLSRRAGALCFD